MNFHIVSSTHWDREWYEPFQKYRFRLVRMMDALLDILEEDPEYRSFHFDGQTVVLQDYLNIRPENAGRLEKLIKAGRIEIGPWYTMPEEWLVSGESLVKNLQVGRQICAEYGVECSPCGYICDLFGHNSQMPQIFRQFGVENTAFFRGMEDTRKDLFRWEGADGSVVTVNKMHRDYAYSTFYFVVRYPFELREFNEEEIVKRFGEFLEREKNNDIFTLDNVMLMDGVDHIDPEERLPQLLDILRKAFPEHTFTHSNMDTYFKSVQADLGKLEKFTGCIYDVATDSVNQAVLKNCLSSLADQKQDNSYCETALEQVVSPLNFLVTNAPSKAKEKHFHSTAPYNGFFEEAWNLLIQNHAHDSICGCSVTATHQDTKNRFKNAREIIEVTEKNLMLELAGNVDTAKEGYDGAWVIYNHAQEDMSGVHVVELPLVASPLGRNLRIFDENGNQLDYAFLNRKSEYEKDTTFNMVIRFPETEFLRTVLPLNVPAGGYKTLFYRRLVDQRDAAVGWEFQQYFPPYRLGGSMRTQGLTFDTGAIVAEVKNNGTLKVTNKTTGKSYDNLLSFEDCGDIGEGWNYVAPEYDSMYSSMANDASVSVEKDNALAAVIRITNRMYLPVKSEWTGRSAEKADFIIENVITLLKGSAQVSVVTKVDNQIVNHRLRAVFPTGLAAEKFSTQLPFDYYSWDVKKKDNTYCKEKDTYVNPNQGAASLTEGRDTFAVYNKGLYEVSVMDDAERTMRLTLFRSFTNETGCVNHKGLGTMTGEYTFEYAMDFLADADNSTVLRRANAFKAGASAKETGIHAGLLPAGMQVVKTEGKAIVSLLQGNIRHDGENFNEVRIYDVVGGDSGTLAFFKPVKKAYRTDLAGGVLEEIQVRDGKIPYQLSNRQIATYLFQF